MFPQFRNQLFQLPLIATTWTNLQNRYIEEKKTSSFPVRFILSSIEQTISVVHSHIIKPSTFDQWFISYYNKWDDSLCSSLDSFRRLCPIVDQTADKFLELYGDLFFISIFHKNSKTSTNNHSDQINHSRKERKTPGIERYFQLISNILMIIEIYSKHIQNEFFDYIGTTRNLWKTLNMEDGRSIEEVDSFSEKLLVLGRRMIGNYRQFVYLMRFHLRRSRDILFSCLRVQHRFRSTVWRLTKKIQMNRMNQTLNERTRYGLVSSKDRIQHYLDVMMLYAAKHPWMRWTSPQPNPPVVQPQLKQRLKIMRPTFFLSSNNTSDCSETEENYRERRSKIFESTPYRTNAQHSNVIDDVLSDISTSSPEQSFDAKEILRQVGGQSHDKTDTSSSLDNQEEENRAIEEALNEFDEIEPDQQNAVSVFDLSPMLASGSAV